MKAVHCQLMHDGFSLSNVRISCFYEFHIIVNFQVFNCQWAGGFEEISQNIPNQLTDGEKMAN